MERLLIHYEELKEMGVNGATILYPLRGRDWFVKGGMVKKREIDGSIVVLGIEVVVSYEGG